jgi:protoporphyrinogen oxidase
MSDGFPSILIIGAGPAGLTAAMELHKAGVHSTVLEKDAFVGGLSRTVNHEGYRFDIGGHRFFTKVEEVNRFWDDVLGAEFRHNSRISRIYFNQKYFDYPLKAANVLRGLGLSTSIAAFLSYFRAHLQPRSPEVSLEDYFVNRFGRVLHEIFFKTYTEKIWGIPCSGISADWAAQRIRGLSFYGAVKSALFPGSGNKIKTLIDSFHYPRLGPGQMWEAVEARLNAAGNPVLRNAEAVLLKHNGDRILSVAVATGGERRTMEVQEVICSMPLRELVERLVPPPPPGIIEAARALRYRDFLTVALMIDQASLFRDNWIYIHDHSVQVCRIQNYANWSPDLVPEPGRSCLGLEYFCFEGDALWAADDRDLVDLARKEIGHLGLANSQKVLGGVVVRMKKAYPVYDPGYQTRLKVIRDYLVRFRNLHPVGRNGLHKYNNQDHSMYTAMLTVRNLLGEKHDVWAVNSDCQYQEEMVNDGRSSH